jgi:hypothetical protein
MSYGRWSSFVDVDDLVPFVGAILLFRGPGRSCGPRTIEATAS